MVREHNMLFIYVCKSVTGQAEKRLDNIATISRLTTLDLMIEPRLRLFFLFYMCQKRCTQFAL